MEIQCKCWQDLAGNDKIKNRFKLSLHDLPGKKLILEKLEWVTSCYKIGDRNANLKEISENSFRLFI